MIVGIVGKIGAGKDTLGDLVAQELLCEKYDISDIVREEANSKGVSLARGPLTNFSHQMLTENGQHYFLDKLLSRLKDTPTMHSVIASVRSPSNVSRIREEFEGCFELINVVIPDQELRYRRIIDRADAKDSNQYELLLASDKEQEEIFQLSETGKLADATVDNSNSLEELCAWVVGRYRCEN